MLPLLFAWLAPAADALEVANVCAPNCHTKIVWMDIEIEPEWLTAEVRRLGRLESLEIEVWTLTGEMQVTVNGYVLDSRYQVGVPIRGITTYRVPVATTDTVGVTVENLRGTTLEYQIEIEGSTFAAPR